jgi:tetratricopeptide (TPR) repeat protein
MLVKKITIKKYEQPKIPNERKEKVLDRIRKKFRSTHPVSICLCMIVKNESKNMVRLLNSVKSIIDFISITDTGSSDNTEEIIKNWGSENKIPTAIHKEPFRNFGYNRTFSFQAAKKSFPNATYALLSDADFKWEIDEEFDKNSLVRPFYYVKQYNDFCSYWNIRLIDMKYNWECKGVTHEYWECVDIVTTDDRYKLDKIKINDIGDGGCKADKYVRDERLLREGIKTETNQRLVTRYTFYLAQTLRDMKKFEDAIIWYKERIKQGGWFEEVFYSYYQIGRCYNFMGNLEKAKEYYLKAYEYNKKRSEPLYHLICILIKEGKLEEVKKYVEIAKTIQPPEDQVLFIERECYRLFGFNC